MTPEFNEESKIQTIKPTELPSVTALFSEGWNYAKNNLLLVVLLSAPFFVTDVLSYLAVLSGGSYTAGVSFLEAVVSLGAFVVYVFFMATALHMVVHQSIFSAGFAWAKKRVLSLLWISVLTMVVVGGGFLLLIIPGIIVAVYLSLSQIVLAAEDKTGLDALMRSRELVYGNWAAMFRKMVGIQALYLLIVIVCGVLLGVLATYFTNEAFGDFMTNILFTVLGSVGTLIFLSATWRLYSVLRVQSDVSAAPIASARTKYSVLGWLGLLVPVVLLPLLSIGMMATMTGSYNWQEQSQDSVLKESLQFVQFEADQYSTQQPALSYAGVCEEVSQYVQEKGDVICNDSDDAYALSVTNGVQTYCADSTGYNKIIYTDLGSRTQCLEVGSS